MIKRPDLMKLAKSLAVSIWNEPEPEEWLARWWTKKYGLPWNHELFQERTLLDLLVEYYLDLFDEKPLEAHRGDDGEIQLRNTGDSFIDRWEQQIASGQAPDLWESFLPEQRAKIEQVSKDRKEKLSRDFGSVVNGLDPRRGRG